MSTSVLFIKRKVVTPFKNSCKFAHTLRFQSCTIWHCHSGDKSCIEHSTVFFYIFSPLPHPYVKIYPHFGALLLSSESFVEIHLANDSNFCTFTYGFTLLKYTCSNNYQLLYYKHHSNEYVCEQNVSNIHYQRYHHYDYQQWYLI